MRLSASKLTTFNQCQQKFHYAYNLKLPRTNINPRTQLGIVVHKALEIFYKEFRYQPLILPTMGWLKESYDRAWSEQKKSLPADEHTKLWEMGWQGLSDYYYRYISTDTILG